jgi:hypothetical protein
MALSKVHAVKLLPDGRAISRCSAKPNDWILSVAEREVTCARCLAALAFDRQAAERVAHVIAEHDAREERRKVQQFLQRQKFMQRPGDDTL